MLCSWMHGGPSLSELKASSKVSIVSCTFCLRRLNVARTDGFAVLYITRSGLPVIFARSMFNVCVGVIRLSVAFDIFDFK